MASPKILLFILEVPNSRLMKMTGDFYDLESAFVSSELHLDLKSIAFGSEHGPDRLFPAPDGGSIQIRQSYHAPEYR